MLKFCIIENSQKSSNKMSTMLEHIFVKNDFDAEISFATTDANSLISYVSNNPIDVLLLDTDLGSEHSGLKFAEKIRENNKYCYLIFISSHFEFVLNAYKYKTFDFLIKPLTSTRLEETIIRLFDDIKEPNKKFVKLNNGKIILAESEIEYIKRDGMKIIFHTATNDYAIYSSFVKIKDMLPANFVRCHKSFVANINNIKKIDPVSNVIYFSDSFCDIGPKYKNNFINTIK